jgi:hypothetical protein
MLDFTKISYVIRNKQSGKYIRNRIAEGGYGTPYRASMTDCIDVAKKYSAVGLALEHALSTDQSSDFEVVKVAEIVKYTVLPELDPQEFAELAQRLTSITADADRERHWVKSPMLNVPARYRVMLGDHAKGYRV